MGTCLALYSTSAEYQLACSSHRLSRDCLILFHENIISLPQTTRLLVQFVSDLFDFAYFEALDRWSLLMKDYHVQNSCFAKNKNKKILCFNIYFWIMIDQILTLQPCDHYGKLNTIINFVELN